MNFPVGAKNRDFFSVGKDVYRYNETYNAWTKIMDINKTIDMVSDYSKYTKENPSINSYVVPVNNGLADVSFLNIPVTKKGRPNNRKAYLFVYDENSDTNNIPIMSYVKGDNDGITIIDGNLQVSDPDVTEIRILYDDTEKTGMGFYTCFNNKDSLGGNIILSVYSQNDKFLTVYIEENSIVCLVDNIMFTRELQEKNFVYIDIKDFKDFEININGRINNIENSFDLFYPVSYDFDYDLTSDFDVTSLLHSNNPYYLYNNKDLSFINYTNDLEDHISNRYPKEIKLVSGEINLDNYIEGIFPGSIINIYFSEGGKVQYTYSTNETTEDTIKENTKVSYIWNGETWSALSNYPVGAVYFTVINDNPQSLFGGSWIPQTNLNDYIKVWTRVI